MRVRLVEFTPSQQNIAEAAERIGLMSGITALAGYGQCLLKVPGRLLVMAERHVNIAEPDPDFGHAGFVARTSPKRSPASRQMTAASFWWRAVTAAGARAVSDATASRWRVR